MRYSETSERSTCAVYGNCTKIYGHYLALDDMLNILCEIITRLTTFVRNMPSEGRLHIF